MITLNQTHSTQGHTYELFITSQKQNTTTIHPTTSNTYITIAASDHRSHSKIRHCACARVTGETKKLQKIALAIEIFAVRSRPR